MSGAEIFRVGWNPGGDEITLMKSEVWLQILNNSSISNQAENLKQLMREGKERGEKVGGKEKRQQIVL